MKKFLLSFALLAAVGTSRAAIPEDQAVRAIIGEAANQGYGGMLAVACAIRNRGTLDGVYGLHSKLPDQQPQWVWNLARLAWRRSQQRDVTHGATHWENVKAFGLPSWARNMRITLRLRDHTFFAPAV